MGKKYLSFLLEITLKDPTDTSIYAFENVSFIPTLKLIEIFDINLKKDPNILEGYFLTKDNYLKHQTYISQHFVPINLDIFEYCLRQYSYDVSTFRKLYKESLME